MCIYRNVRRPLSSTATALLMTFGGILPAGGQLAGVAGAGTAEKISLVAVGDAVVWTHEEGHQSTLYSARAPDYRPARVSSMAAGERVPGLRGPAAVSPDGAWILLLRDGLLYRVPAAEGAFGQEMVGGKPLFETIGLITHAAWSPDGSRIAFVMAAPKARSMPDDAAASVPSFVGVFDLETGRRWFLSPSRERDASPVWTPDGSEIFFQRKVRGEEVVGAADDARAPAESMPAASGDGMIAPASSLMVADVETGEVRVLWTDTEDAVVLIGPGGSSHDATASAGHVVAPPLASIQAGR